MFSISRASLRQAAVFAAAILSSWQLLSALSWAQEGSARARVEKVLSGGGELHALGQVAISPDGSTLAYAERVDDRWQVVVAPRKHPEKVARISEAQKGSGKNSGRDAASCDERMLAWAPDSKRLALVGNCPGGSQNNVFLATISGDLAGGKPRFDVSRLSDAKGEVGLPAFSPDGSKIAFLYVEGATRSAGALDAMKPWAGVIGEDGIEIQRVAMVDAGAKKPAVPTMMTPAQLHVYEFDWAPDSKTVAYVAADPPGENNWWVAKLYTQALGAEPKAIFAPAESSGPLHGLQIAVPRWSPDQKSIAFIGGLMSDQGSTGGDVWLIPSQGGDPRDLTPERQTSIAWIIWGGEHTLFLSELAGGNSQLDSIDTAGQGTMAQGTSLTAPIYSFPGAAQDGRLAQSLSATEDKTLFVFTASSYDHPPEIFAADVRNKPAADLAGLQQLTHFNDGVERIWGETKSLEWNNEGFKVQGWLHFPKNYQAESKNGSKKFALIVLVHGGPAAAAESRWGGRNSLSATALSALGYFVLEPNPRGSFGQGEAFTAANQKDFGYGDLRDILAGVDMVLEKYPTVDPKRLGLTGWSYGGFMTMFAVTQTQRFKAAVAGAGISDWKSYYGENSIDQWMTPYFGASVYNDPAVYAKSSAIDFIERAKTPTLVVVGDRDGECPAPQSFEFWHALRDQHVPTQLVVYPNEGHGFSNPEHRTDVLVRTLDWFTKYLPAGQ